MYIGIRHTNGSLKNFHDKYTNLFLTINAVSPDEPKKIKNQDENLGFYSITKV
jgi:hypothetical protein